MLLAHAKAYHLARSLGINGTISFKTNGGYKIPLTNSSADALAVQRAWDFNEGWFANPTFINGDYPQYLKEYVSGLGLEFTDEEKASINGTADIFAHDAYTSQFYMGEYKLLGMRRMATNGKCQLRILESMPASPTAPTPSTPPARTRRILTVQLTEVGTSVPPRTLSPPGSTKPQTG